MSFISKKQKQQCPCNGTSMRCGAAMAQDLEAGGPHQQELVLRLPSLAPGADPTPLPSPGWGGKWSENTQNESPLWVPSDPDSSCCRARCEREERPTHRQSLFLHVPAAQQPFSDMSPGHTRACQASAEDACCRPCLVMAQLGWRVPAAHPLLAGPSGAAPGPTAVILSKAAT